MDVEYLGRVMAVLRIEAARWLARASDIEPVVFVDVDMLVRIFGYAGADDSEVFLLVRPG
jgi:hypothetical protein